MGYFPVRYDSGVVNYDRKMFIRLATGSTEMARIFALTPFCSFQSIILHQKLSTSAGIKLGFSE